MLLITSAWLVLIAIDGAAGTVLIAVDLRALRRRQLATVRGSIALDLVVDLGFAPFELCGLARGEGAILHAFGDPLLLASFAPIDFRSESGNGEGENENSDAGNRICFHGVSR